MLANYLADLKKSSSCNSEDIRRCLQDWQTTVQPRIGEIWHSACDLTRIEAKATLKGKILVYILPYLQTLLLNKQSAVMVSAVKLDCVPPPARSLQGSIPFKDLKRSERKGENGRKSMMLGALLVGVVAVGWNWRRLLV